MKQLSQLIKELRGQKGTQTAVSKKLGIPSQSLGAYERGDYEPKSDFFDKWKEVFNEDIRAILKENNEGNLSRGTQNLTGVEKTGDNKEIKGEFYTKLVEANTEYRLVPKIILDEYKIVHKAESDERALAYKESLETKKDLIATKDELLASQRRLIKELEEELAEYRSRAKAVSVKASAKH